MSSPHRKPILPRFTPRRRLSETVRRLQNFISQNAAEGKHALVAIDEAHLIDDIRTFEASVCCLISRITRKGLSHCCFVGQPGLLVQFERMPAFEERLGVKCLLKPFSVDETAAYVNFRLQAAGAKANIFEPDSMETLHQLSHGFAREINRLLRLGPARQLRRRTPLDRQRATRSRRGRIDHRDAGISPV